MLPPSQPALLLTFEDCIRGHSENRLMASWSRKVAGLCLLAELVMAALSGASSSGLCYHSTLRNDTGQRSSVTPCA